MPGSSMGVNVRSTTDRQGMGPTVALGGIVTAPSLTIVAAQRIASSVNRQISVGFTTASTVPSGQTIIIALPAGFVTAVTSGTPTNSGLTASQALVVSNIVLTATADITAGAKTVTICGVTLGLTTVDTNTVVVTTARDYTTSCSATGIVGVALGSITAVSMTIPFANRVADTAQSAVFAFTTSRNIPAAACGTPNTLTLSVPAGFFRNNGATATATGLAGYTATANLAANPLTIVLTGTGALTAGTVTVTISGLTLGVRTVGSDNGVTVAAPLHSTSFGDTSGPIDNYQVTSVAVTGTCQTGSTCRTVTIGINAAGAARTVGAGQTLVISGLPFAGTADAMSFGTGVGTIVTAGPVTTNSITLTVHANGAAWSLGTTATITLTGLTLASASVSPFDAWTVSVGSSTPMWSQKYVATSTGTTTTTSLTLARAVPKTENTQATIAFSTTNGIANSNTIRVNYPVGFFVATPVDTTCAGSTVRYSLAGTLGTCGTMRVSDEGAGFTTFTYTGPTTAAGAQTLVFSGVTLSATERAASNTFSVVVSSSSCSAGSVTTGSISNSNPGGPGARVASGVNLMLSAVAAFTCAIMFLL